MTSMYRPSVVLYASQTLDGDVEHIGEHEGTVLLEPVYAKLMASCSRRLSGMEEGHLDRRRCPGTGLADDAVQLGPKCAMPLST
jgi:hypothetical protein